MSDAPKGELTADLSQWAKARFGVFLPDGRFEEIEPESARAQEFPYPRWAGGTHDMEVIRAALAQPSTTMADAIAHPDGYTPADFACWILANHPHEFSNEQNVQKWLAGYNSEVWEGITPPVDAIVAKATLAAGAPSEDAKEPHPPWCSGGCCNKEVNG